MAREVSRSRRSRDEDEEERPAIRRGRSRRDEDEEPRGRGPRDGDDHSYDEDEDRPQRSRSRRARDEDEDRPARRSRSRRGDGDDDRSSRSEGFKAPSNTGRGRASVKRHRETHQSSDFAPRFTVDKDAVLIKVLDEEWFFTYYEHWIQEFRGQKRQQSFGCLGEDECPLDEIGDTPAFRALINVVDFSDPKDPELKVWYATPNPIDALEEYMDDAKTKPINRDDLYFSVAKKKGKNGFFTYTITPVKERDLEEDWGVEPLTEGELEDFESRKFNEDACVRFNTRRQLQDIADELTDGD